METGSNSTSCMMSFGDNSNELCPMLMMMPLMTSSSNSHHHAPDSSSNPLLPPLLPSPSNQTLPNRTASFSMVLDNLNHLNTAPNPNSACYFMDNNTTKAKIMAHPLYHRLLAAYINCQKVGAPTEVVTKLEEACASASAAAAAMAGTSSSCLGEDPALDQFMEAYCEMLIKYEQELSKPFKEAMLFIQRVERQFNELTIPLPNNSACGGESYDKNGSSEEEDIDVNNNYIDPQAENHELKGQLLRRYSGYLGNLKQEFMRKKKKGKLPKEARQQLIDWWDHHRKWPYPSEAEKLTLAKTTGLDQKQINNWFINQRKRHWKPSEDMQYHLAMDAAHSHYYMDNVLGHPYLMDISPTPY